MVVPAHLETVLSIPTSTHPVWLRLAGGALSRLKTQHLGTQLMIKRVERSTDPNAIKAAEIYAFFAKWERALSTEIHQITTL